MNVIRQTVRQAALRGTVEGDWRAFYRKWMRIFEAFTDRVYQDTKRALLDEGRTGFGVRPPGGTFKDNWDTLISPYFFSVRFERLPLAPKIDPLEPLPEPIARAIGSLGFRGPDVTRFQMGDLAIYVGPNLIRRTSRKGKLASKWLALIDRYNAEYEDFEKSVHEVMWDAARMAGMNEHHILLKVVHHHISPNISNRVTISAKWNQEVEDDQVDIFFDYMEEHAGLSRSQTRDPDTYKPIWNIEA